MNIKHIIIFAPFYLLSLLPLFILHFLSDIVALFLFVVVKYRRKVVLDNLQKSFPEKDSEEINQIQKEFYRQFCAVFIEAVKSISIRKSVLIKRFKVINPELIETYFKEKKSIILYGGHFGNWELMSSLPLQIPHTMLSFYKEQPNKYFNQLILIIRERFNHKCIESKTGFKTLLEYNRKKHVTLTYMAGDQSPKYNSTIHWTQFLNRETAFLIGADHIAKKTGHSLMYPNIRKIRRGYYEIEFIEIEPSGNDEYRYIDKYANLLEQNIKQQPELWLWSHKRWKLFRT